MTVGTSFDNDVTYTTIGGIDVRYRSKLTTTDNPLRGAVLIVDEVDALLCDRNPTSHFVMSETKTEAGVQRALTKLKAGEASATDSSPPDGVSEREWREAKTGYRGYTRVLEAGQNQAGGYCVVNGYFCLLDEHRHRSNYTDPTVRALNYLGDDVQRASPLPSRSAAMMTVYYARSMPHVLAKYDRILGLSGSLGSDAEQQFIKQTYQAEFMHVPRFLDTCRDHRHSPPTLLGVSVTASLQAHAKVVAALAEAKARHVPVLVIANSPDEAMHIRDAIVQLMGVHRKGSVQLALQ